MLKWELYPFTATNSSYGIMRIDLPPNKDTKMDLEDRRAQIRIVLISEFILLAVGFSISIIFWESLCSDTWVQCITNAKLSFSRFLTLSLWRPFLFTPIELFYLMAGSAYGASLGTIVGAIGATISCAGVYFLAKVFGHRLVNPWLSNNLPQTLRFVRSQGFKAVLACRLIPFLPFDLASLVFGMLDFRWRYVLAATVLGSLPEAYVFARMAEPNASLKQAVWDATLVSLVIIFLPAFFYEAKARREGRGLMTRLQAMWDELHHEVRTNNSIVKNHRHDPRKIPVLLVYGFFSSRRTLTVLERILKDRGHEVFSFNLGGLLGTFFTSSITDTANFIDYKIKRQIKRHHLKKVYIVAHSKGGLVSLWWLLKLGGSKYCDRIVTMGAPFRGTPWAWLALLTPLGFVLKDVWQMRPGARLLEELDRAEIPKRLKIFCMYSRRDWVSFAKGSQFQANKKSKQIIHIPMHHVPHFDFLARRDVAHEVANLLGSPYLEETVAKERRLPSK